MHLNQRNLKRQKFWEDHLKNWGISGSNQTDYCRKNKLDQQLFSKWKIRLSKGKENKLIKIPVKLKNQFQKTDDIDLIINEKYKIKIPPVFNQETLKKLIQTIEG
jgi:hypothetical protein